MRSVGIPMDSSKAVGSYDVGTREAVVSETKVNAAVKQWAVRQRLVGQ